MRVQVYAILYDKVGNFLIATKFKKGYFFLKKEGDGGEIVPDGQPLNGGGKYAFPGGELEFKDDKKGADEGAKKEFFEETNLKLPDSLPCLAQRWKHNERWAYWGVFYEVEDLWELYPIITENLLAGFNAALDVQNKIFSKGQYDLLREKYPSAPVDNECQTIDILNIYEAWDEIHRWKDDQDLGWFETILAHLKNTILS
jgi:8-oxo-dGTP pyrophosphatase MutT (NUDIX family)